MRQECQGMWKEGAPDRGRHRWEEKTKSPSEMWVDLFIYCQNNYAPPLFLPTHITFTTPAPLIVLELALSVFGDEISIARYI